METFTQVSEKMGDEVKVKARRRCAPPFSCYPRKTARWVFKHPSRTKVNILFEDRKPLFHKFGNDSTKRINFVLQKEPKQFFVLLFFDKPYVLEERASGGLVLCGLFSMDFIFIIIGWLGGFRWSEPALSIPCCAGPDLHHQTAQFLVMAEFRSKV